MKKGQKINLQVILSELNIVEHVLGRYIVILFFLLVVGVYGYVLFRIGTLSSAQPSDADVSAEVKAAVVPHIDPNAVQQIQNLQDNNVSVQTLFNQARDNPFHE